MPSKLTLIWAAIFSLPLVLASLSGCKEQAKFVAPVSTVAPVSQAPVFQAPVASQTLVSDVLAVDRLQREVRFVTHPQRIISLTPATTELLFAIGAGPQIVGATKNCNYPIAAEQLTRVGGGTLESLSHETIVSLHPDLVLCQWDNHQPLMETLDQLKIPTLAIGPENLDELFVEAAMLGNVTGHAVEAEELVAQMTQRLETLTSRVSLIPEAQRRKVFYEVWDDPLMTAGPGSFIGEVLRLAGMQNIFFDATRNYPKVSDEVVVARNPDVILSPSTHASKVSIEKLLERQGWGNVKAVREKQVYIINGDHVSRCGPRLLDALEEIIRVAYPDHVATTQKPEERLP
jgi:iron complex transport system substrate-binding protein